MWSAGQFTKATILFCFSYCAEQSMNGKDDSFMVGYIYISDLERKKSPQDRNLFLQQRELSPKQQSQVSSWGAKLSMLTSLCFCILILVFLLTALASHGPILSWFTVTSPGHWRWRAVCKWGWKMYMLLRGWADKMLGQCWQVKHNWGRLCFAAALFLTGNTLLALSSIYPAINLYETFRNIRPFKISVTVKFAWNKLGGPKVQKGKMDWWAETTEVFVR